MFADWVIVKVFATRVEAEVAKSLLESGGVESIISADDLGGMQPGMTGRVRLLVPEDDSIEAQRILDGIRIPSLD